VSGIVYVVIWEDHHADTDVTVFTDPGAAVEWAKAKANECNRSGELIEPLINPMRNDGWLYYGMYSQEGDHLRVVERCIQ
jgi:hypothetical protein